MLRGISGQAASKPAEIAPPMQKSTTSGGGTWNNFEMSTQDSHSSARPMYPPMLPQVITRSNLLPPSRNFHALHQPSPFQYVTPCLLLQGREPGSVYFSLRAVPTTAESPC